MILFFTRSLFSSHVFLCFNNCREEIHVLQNKFSSIKKLFCRTSFPVLKSKTCSISYRTKEKKNSPWICTWKKKQGCGLILACGKQDLSFCCFYYFGREQGNEWKQGEDCDTDYRLLIHTRSSSFFLGDGEALTLIKILNFNLQ